MAAQASVEKAGKSGRSRLSLPYFPAGTWLIMTTRILSMAFILFVTITPDVLRPPAAETMPPPAPAGASLSALPACVNSEPAIAEARRILTANSANARKYDGYRKLLHSDSAVVLAARLAYAETVAANCAAHNDEILDLVASVIANRVRIRHGDVGGVVFQRNQFASSLHIYAESRYRDFLCPSDANLWRKAFLKMQANLESAVPSAPIPKDAVNYYLYRHSDRFVAPDWGLDEVDIGSEEVRKCIRVFRNSAWR